MIDPDILTILALVVVVIAVLMAPPGPGSPLHSPVQSR
jgi:hypothetical protein